MTIVFLYPGVKNVPNGGLKIIYEYANMLVKDGHNVYIVYAAYFKSLHNGLTGYLKSIIKYLYMLLVRKREKCKWFALDNSVNEKYVWQHSFCKVPFADCYVATAVTTAPYLKSYPIPDGRKYYFIQDYEYFICPNDALIKETYRYPFVKIAVSKWLSRMIEKEGQECYFIPNGFDWTDFYLTIPITQKNKFHVSMLYHEREAKDSAMGLKALKIAKKIIPNLSASLFGVHDKPTHLPSWITYFKNPSKEVHLRINNEAAIYIGTSKKEGWGLTVGEAMMCGQAVACTDNLGYQEMAIDGYNALLSPIEDAEALASNIVRLVNDDVLRCGIAERGLQSIKEFDKQKSYDSLKNLLIEQK